MILQRAGHDLRRARRKLVHEYDERHVRPLLWRVRVVRARHPAGTPTRRQYGVAAVEEQVGYRNTLIEQSSGIESHVEDQGARPRVAECGDCFAEFVRRLRTEGLEMDISDSGRHHGRVTNRRHMDQPSLDIKPEWTGKTRSNNRECHRRPGLAPEEGRCFFGRPAERRNALDLDDAIARLDSGFVGRRARQRGDHGEPTIGDFDAHTESAVITPRVQHQLLEIVGSKETRIRITEIPKHAVDREVVEMTFVD